MSTADNVAGLTAILIICMLCAACGGGTAYVQFSPEEQTVTRVQSDNGLITAVFPPDSLDSSVEISLRDRSAEDLGLPGVDGRSLALALEISGSIPAPPAETPEEDTDAAASAVNGRFIPATLSGSVELSIRLGKAWPLATPLDVQSWNSASRRYEEAGISGSLAEDAMSITITISQFGRYAIYGPLAVEYPPPAPAGPRLSAASSSVRRIEWDASGSVAGYNIYRSAAAEDSFSKLNDAPLTTTQYIDILDQPGSYRYSLTSLRDNGIESEQSAALLSPAVDFDLLGQIRHQSLLAPDNLLLDPANQRLLVCDTGFAAVLAFGLDGELLGRQDMLGQAPMRNPTALALDPDNGTLYLCDSGYQQVFLLRSDLSYRSRFGSGGSGPGEFLEPMGILSNGERLTIVDSGRNLLQLFTPLGVYLDEALDPLDEELQLSLPQGIHLLADGSMLLADSGNDRLVQLDADYAMQGEVLRPEENGSLAAPHAVVSDVLGRLFVSEPAMRRVSVFDSSGEYLFQFGSEGLLHVEFGVEGPMGLAYDPATGYLYVADPSAGRIAIFAS